MRWRQREYSRNKIVKAGKTIRRTGEVSDVELTEAREIVDNWRASHAFPLQVFYVFLRKRFPARSYIVAQRLKRLSSISGKLIREPSMSLWAMQDLGGCRVVVPRIEDIPEAIALIKSSRIRHKLIKENDYIANPRKSGYRSYHMVYRYHSERNSTYNNNMLIEIQIRTHLQHLWATAVEAMGLLTKQALKASVGDEKILDFFRYVSSLFALEEATAQVPGYEGTREGLIRLIRQYDEEGNYTAKLSACKVTLEHAPKSGFRKGAEYYYLLRLDYSTRRLGFRTFSNSADASDAYNESESDVLDNESIDIVLVSSTSLNQLKRAYPNYFSDLIEFVNKLEKMIDGF